MQRKERTRVRVVIGEAQLKRAVCLLDRAEYLSGLPSAERDKLGVEDRRLISIYERPQREMQALIDSCMESEVRTIRDDRVYINVR